MPQHHHIGTREPGIVAHVQVFPNVTADARTRKRSIIPVDDFENALLERFVAAVVCDVPRVAWIVQPLIDAGNATLDIFKPQPGKPAFWRSRPGQHYNDDWRVVFQFSIVRLMSCFVHLGASSLE